MFTKLKRNFVLTTVIATAVVLAVAFATIYLVTATNLAQRPRVHVEIPPNANVSEDLGQDLNELNTAFDQQLRSERQASLNTLLITLIITGITIEAIVAIFSIIMAEQAVRPVKDAYLAQKSFIANASHEIKTPLAVIQANLEAADIQGNHWLDNVSKKVEDLTALNNQLLTLARLESATSTERPATEKVSLGQLVQETADFYQPQATEKGVKLRTKTIGDVTLDLPKADLAQILNILIDNAVKYSKSKINLSIEGRKISITNDGATISPEGLEHIFDRFYQTDKTSSGVGLGLAIAKNVTERNHWQLEATSDTKSTTFALKV